MNWLDPSIITNISTISAYLIVFMYGLYVRELAATLWFEVSFFKRNRQERQLFQWPHVLFYLMARYTTLASLTGLTVSLLVKDSRVKCQALATFNAIMGNTAILCSTASVMFRAVVLFNKNRIVIGVLGTLTLAHWVILYRSALLVTIRRQGDSISLCADVVVNPLWLDMSLFYTMGFDLIIFFFMIIALFREHSISNGSILWKKLYSDSVWFVIISTTANTIPAVLSVLNLNPPMNVMMTVPAAVITSIASCRFVLGLVKLGKSYAPPFDTLPQTMTSLSSPASDRTIMPMQDGTRRTVTSEAFPLEVMGSNDISSGSTSESQTDTVTKFNRRSISTVVSSNTFGE